MEFNIYELRAILDDIKNIRDHNLRFKIKDQKILESIKED